MKNRSLRAFSLIEVLTVVAVVGMMAAIALPNLLKARQTAQRETCISNLRSLDKAIQQWGTENKKAANDTYSLSDATLTLYFKGSQLPICPAGGTYSAAANLAGTPTCSHSDIGHTL